MTRRTSTDNPNALAERLIKLASSKRAAHCMIDAAQTKGKMGRPKGSPYLERDAQLLFLVESMQNEYRLAHRTEPKRRTLIIEVMPDETARRGFGQSKDAAVARVAGRPNLAAIVFELIRLHRPDLVQHLPDDAEARLGLQRDDPSKANFAAILTILLSLWGLVRRHPKRIARAARSTKDPNAVELVRFLSRLRLDDTVTANPSEKLQGN